ncbi:uncharacterized protein BT62DRAFT_582619 [Guyanagaster necrorhizus]|uniref:Uncharacterized protein n=1 Tax=Guyanagaster necrorhizus TaxID=856835 RepID=A0A9P7VGA7_9AGAR|nr:uncharacterized protein BT62DRAFT_582619 [Guyanagaster necrorhizus MCA 3950]KAG7440431.1 hypothetical protein BT62DRAFT_582619 [Guyanagaster necrorhizus MCA 3950]
MVVVTPTTSLLCQSTKKSSSRLSLREPRVPSHTLICLNWHASACWSRNGSPNVVSTYRCERHDVCRSALLCNRSLARIPIGTVASMSLKALVVAEISSQCLFNTFSMWPLTVPAIMYIDKWGRRPMLLFGTLFIGFFLFLVGGLQGHFGYWGVVDGD